MIFETILTSFFAVRVVYPFLLIFTLIFAILEKAQILGESKRQVDALVALAISLIVVALPWPVDIIINLMPFLAVSLVIILVFMLLFGFVASTGDEALRLSPGIRWTFFAVIVIALVIAVLVATGQWDKVYNGLFVDYGRNTVLTNLVLLIIIIAAILIVVNPFKRTSTEGK